MGKLRSLDMIDDLEDKAEGRRFFAQLLAENFADLKESGKCGPLGTALPKVRSWVNFLHSDETHIKVMRTFRGGHREFRTLSAMFRSEFDIGGVPPVQGTESETLMMSRHCPKEH